MSTGIRAAGRVVFWAIRAGSQTTSVIAKNGHELFANGHFEAIP